MKTWTDVYSHLKDKKNPLKLSTSEFRNLTKKMAKYIFEQGQVNAGEGVNHSAAILVLNDMTVGLKSGGERYKALVKAVEALKEDEKGATQEKAA